MTGNGNSARLPLSADRLRAALVRPGGFWRDVRVVAQTGSTNADLLADARNGAAEGAVLAAEAQSAGRGRMGRRWVSPPRAALTFSVLLRPAAVPPAKRGWVPLLAGVAVVGALRAEAGIDAQLKWPNDVLVNGAKLAGILAEQSGDAIVVGAGINVSTRPDELAADSATSLILEGVAGTDRDQLLARLLAGLEHWYLAWAAGSTRPAGGRAADRPEPGDAEACGLRQEYQRRCGTLGQQVQVTLPGGRTVAGAACEVDGTGRLVIKSASGVIAVSAGDVVHVR